MLGRVEGESSAHVDLAVYFLPVRIDAQNGVHNGYTITTAPRTGRGGDACGAVC